MDEPKVHKGRKIKRRASSNQRENQNAISEGKSAIPRRSKNKLGSKTDVIKDSGSDIGEGIGGDVDRIDIQASGLHAERREVGQSPSGCGGTSPAGHGLEDSESLHSEGSGDAGGSGRESDSRSIAASGERAGSGVPLQQQLKLLREPVTFCQTFCSSHKYVGWQRDFINDCRVVDENGQIHLSDWPRTVILAAVNGAGKTEIIADVVRYLLSTVPGCVIPITSPIYRQLEMLENYFKAQNHKFPGWSCVEGKLTAPNGNFARWFATDTPTSVESFHGEFLVRILEEAKAMDDIIWDQTNRWQPKLTIIVSSKGLMTGRLYDSITIHRDRNKVHEVDATMCPWIGTKWIEEQIAIHGRNSSLIKSMIFNEFSDVGVRNLISLEQINRCFASGQPWQHPGYRVAGIDLSAAKNGGDACVCIARQGNKLLEPYFLPPCNSEMEAVGLVVRWLKIEKIRFAHIDEGGIGGGMAARLQEIMLDDQSITLHRVNFGGKVFDERKRNKNRGTELWAELANRLELGSLLFDWSQETKDKFIAQATSRQIEPVASDGMIRLQSKDKMRSTGMKSPDLVDAVVLSLIEPIQEKPSALGLTHDWKDFKSGFDSDRKQYGMTASGKSLGRG